MEEKNIKKRQKNIKININKYFQIFNIIIYKNNNNILYKY